MGYDYDRTAATANPADEAKKLAGEILADLAKSDLVAMNDAIADSSAKNAQFVNGLVSSLEGALRAVANRPTDTTGAALDDAMFPFLPQLEALKDRVKDWADRLEAASKALAPRQADVKKVVQLCNDAKAWNEPVVVPKGNKSLGSPWKWAAAQVTLRGVTFLSFITTINGRQYRIAPEDLRNPKSSGWVVDKGGIGWEKVIDETFKSPMDAAVALAQSLS